MGPFFFSFVSASMVNATSLLVCFKARNGPESDSLLKKKGDENVDFLSSTKTVVLALIVTIVYLLGGMLIFYMCQMNQEEDKWSMTQSLYYCVVTISTVGYGDLTPTTALGKWFAIFYMLLGIGLVGLALGIVGGFLMARQEALLMKAVETAGKKRKAKKKLSPTQWRLIGALGILVTFVGIGAIGFYFLDDMKDNGLTATDAFFLAVQTVTTVGYGSPTIQNTATQWFAIPYILISTLLVAAALGTFADVFIERQQEKMAERILKADFDLEAILAMDTDGDASIDMAEFLEYMLVKMGKVSKIDIEKVKNQFRELDVDNSGALDAEDIRIMQERLQHEHDSSVQTDSGLV